MKDELDPILRPNACGVVRFSPKLKAYAGCEGEIVEVMTVVESHSKQFRNGSFIRERICNVCGLKYRPKESEE